MKSTILFTIFSALAPLAVASPCKPSNPTTVANVEPTTTSLSTTMTEGMPTAGSATSEGTTTAETSAAETSEVATTLEPSTAEVSSTEAETTSTETYGAPTTIETSTLEATTTSETTTTFETSTVEPTTTTAAASTTSAAVPEPECGVEGYSNIVPYNNDAITGFHACRAFCRADVECKAFLPDYLGSCYLYKQDVASFVTPSNSGAFFTDRDQDCTSQ